MNDIEKIKNELRVGELIPTHVVVIDPDGVDFYKHAARLKADEERWAMYPYWEGGYGTEYAFRQLLRERNKQYAWGSIYFGCASEAPRDFTVWRYDRKVRIGLRSRRHSDLISYANNPVIFYPTRRNEAKKLANYIVGTSIKNNSDGSASVAFWGVITRSQLLKLLHELEVEFSDKTRQDYTSIPLTEFSKTLFEQLISSLDAR